MNVQAHLSSGQVSNQQQNGNSQMQNLVNGGGGGGGGGPPPTTSNAGLGPSRVDNDLLRLRQSMRIKM